MRILILLDGGEDATAIESAIPEREIVIRRANTIEPVQRSYLFAEWTLDETARDLISAAGRRVDLTSSEFELMVFLRQPGQTLPRTALLAALRGCDGHILIDRYPGRATA
jgi:DNA-binding response OmpR family regulator